MASQTLNYSPIGGINAEDAEISLGETQVRDSVNFLFDRKMVSSRPAAEIKDYGFTGAFKVGKSANFGGVRRHLVVSEGVNLYSINPTTLVSTQITGAAVSSIGDYPSSIGVVNQLMLVGGFSGGLLRWLPSTTNYSLIPTAPYQFVVGHRTRAVAASHLTDSNGSMWIGWSKAGDETNWVDYGSGHSTLPEVGPILGLANVRNIVVVPCDGGFYLGYPVVGDPPFDWQVFSTNSYQAPQPRTFTSFGGMCFFVSSSDVHVFNLSEISNIGRNIRSMLFSEIKNGAVYTGVVTQNIGARKRVLYHLIPMSGSLLHFIYDVEDNTWSKHQYSQQTRGGFALEAGGDSNTLLLGTNTAGQVLQWNPDVECESEQRLNSRVFSLDPITHNFNFSRAMLRYKCNADIPRSSLKLECDTGEFYQGLNLEADLPASEKWRRMWYPGLLAGQNYTADLTIPAGHSVSFDRLDLEISDAGEFMTGVDVNYGTSH
jgi:hypothetical protein